MAKSRLGPIGYGMAPVITTGVLTGIITLALAGSSFILSTHKDGSAVDSSNNQSSSTQIDPNSESNSNHHNGSGSTTDDSESVNNSDSHSSGNDETENSNNNDQDHCDDIASEDGINNEDGESSIDNDNNDSQSSSTSPERDSATEDNSVSYVYHIKPGDTLSEISDEVGVNVDLLARFNGIRDPNLIYRNSTLLIPTPGYIDTCG